MSNSLFRPLLITVLCLAALLRADAVMDKVDINLPTTITFSVNNVLAVTTDSFAPIPITYTNGNLHDSAHLRISVMANAPTCTPPDGGPRIPAGRFTWMATDAMGGVGYSGTLAASDYTIVFQSIPWSHTALSGSVNLTWKMAPPPTGVRAGTHTISLTWKVEAI